MWQRCVCGGPSAALLATTYAYLCVGVWVAECWQTSAGVRFCVCLRRSCEGPSRGTPWPLAEAPGMAALQSIWVRGDL